MGAKSSVSRASTSSTLTFGMVALPVKLYSATEDRKVSFNQLHAAEGCHGRIRNDKKCGTCQEPVTTDEIVKGYEVSKGEYVVVTPDDLESLPLSSLRRIEIERFVSSDDVPVLMLNKPYFLAPADNVGRKSYALIRAAMGSLVGIAKVTIRDREQLACVRVLDGVLTLTTLRWPDEVRTLAGADEFDAEVTPQELELATQLVEKMRGEFDAERYEDGYREALLQMIEAKLAGNVVQMPERKADPAGADLMAALRASIEQTEAVSG